MSDFDLDDDEPLYDLPLPAPPPKRFNTAHRMLNEKQAREAASTSWWVGTDRQAFAKSAARRAQELHDSRAAAKVRTPLNFIGW